MKHYKDLNNGVHGIKADGSQDSVIKDDWILIDDNEVQPLVDALQQAEFDTNDYYRKRLYSYPPISEYIDGLVKGDQAQIDAYIEECRAVKAKYPKV